MLTEEFARATLLDRARQREMSLFLKGLQAGEPRRARRRSLGSLLRVRNVRAQSTVVGMDCPASDGVRLAVDPVGHFLE